MANLAEIVQYEPGIYQLETTDPVLGGPDGIDNLQGKQLANRTAYLKQHVDALESGATVPPGIATQSYVQSAINQLDKKQSVRAASTGNLVLNATQVVDGVNLQVGDRVLVKNQTDPTQNGLYSVAAGAWLRTTDADANSEVTAGLEVTVTEGALQAATIWKLTTPDPINLGVSVLSFTDITTGYAPLASPNFSGNPTAPTAAQFDNDTSVATTAFVQRAIGNKATVLQYNAGANLPASAFGAEVQSYGTGGFTLNLPATAGILPGAQISFMNDCGSGVVTVASGSANISWNGVAASVSSIALGTGDSATLVWTGAGWIVAGGSLQLAYAAAFGASVAANGYQKLPNGLIIQWGTGAGAAASGTISYPVAFPNSAFVILATDASPSYGGFTFSTYPNGNTGFSWYTSANPGGFYWVAIGY